MVMISVIVPVYNLENYIQATVGSIMDQTFKDFELILVDDGSTDDSWNVLQRMAQQDSRIKLIKQYNAGQAKARNKGISISSGEYVTFIDGDDLVKSTYLSNLYSGFKHNKDTDIVVVENETMDSFAMANANLIGKSDLKTITNLTGSEFLEKTFLHNGEVYSVALWGKMYRSDYLRKFTIPEGHFYEDLAIMPKILYEARNVVLVKTRDYLYLEKRAGSSITLVNRKKTNDILWALDYVKKSLHRSVSCDAASPYSVLAFNNVVIVVLWLLRQGKLEDVLRAKKLLNKFSLRSLLKYNLFDDAHLNRRGLLLLIAYRTHIRFIFKLAKRVVL